MGVFLIHHIIWMYYDFGQIRLMLVSDLFTSEQEDTQVQALKYAYHSQYLKVLQTWTKHYLWFWEIVANISLSFLTFYRSNNK